MPTALPTPCSGAVELLQARTPYCAACSRWTGDRPTGCCRARRRPRACIATSGNGSCVASWQVGAACPLGFERCDASEGYEEIADIALTGGACKRYRGAFALVYEPCAADGARALEVAVDAGANLTFGACEAGAVACNLTRAPGRGGAAPTTTLVLRGALGALAGAIADFALCPRCALDDVVVSARLLGARRPRLNMTVRARSSLAQTFTGTVVTNGTRFGSSVALAGARVSLNLTTPADGADAARSSTTTCGRSPPAQPRGASTTTRRSPMRAARSSSSSRTRAPRTRRRRRSPSRSPGTRA